MMRCLILILTLAVPVNAEVARVSSGEHGDFTRLVVELAEPGDWTVGRTAMGYGFATRAEDGQPDYDLSQVWDRIPRTRLQALRVDPDNGALLLTLACDCHVFPFEYVPGTIVLDIRAGPAPPGSSFESALSEIRMPKLHDRAPLAIGEMAYDWVNLSRDPGNARPEAGLSLPVDRQSVSMAPLRDQLLLELSRGAVDGVVEMALPGKPVVPETEGMGDLSGMLIRIGELPGLEIGANAASDGTAATGAVCVPDEAIAVHDWNEGLSPLDLLAAARGGLYGEFDSMSPERLRLAIKAHLYLGFGAEAIQYGALLPGAEPDPELAPLLSIARLIDGEPDPASSFLPMLACKGASALWAALAHDTLPPGAQIDTDAVVLAFQELPAHLRRHLGPRLTALLGQRDAEAARIVRDSVERTPDMPAGIVALLDAEADLLASRPQAALGHARDAVDAGETGLAGLVALVEAHFQSGVPLSPDVADALKAFREASTEEAAQKERAIVLALALSDRFEEAFEWSDAADAVRADLWRTVAKIAKDSPFLTHAVLRPDAPAPEVDPEVSLAMASRLTDLGFPEAALAWLGPVPADAPEERRLAAARAKLSLGDARGALDHLASLAGPEAASLRAEAQGQLGAYASAMLALDASGRKDDSTRLAIWSGNWDEVRERGEGVWETAASLVRPVASDTVGPLAEGKAALSDSAAARMAIVELLAEVPSP